MVEVFDPASTRVLNISIANVIRIVEGFAYQRLFTQPLLSIGWLLACDWLVLDSLWVVPTNIKDSGTCNITKTCFGNRDNPI
jgi:hypothetical protein